MRWAAMRQSRRSARRIRRRHRPYPPRNRCHKRRVAPAPPPATQSGLPSRRASGGTPARKCRVAGRNCPNGCEWPPCHAHRHSAGRNPSALPHPPPTSSPADPPSPPARRPYACPRCWTRAAMCGPCRDGCADRRNPARPCHHRDRPPARRPSAPGRWPRCDRSGSEDRRAAIRAADRRADCPAGWRRAAAYRRRAGRRVQS